MVLHLNDTTIDLFASLAPADQTVVVREWLLRLRDGNPVSDQVMWIIDAVLDSTDTKKRLKYDQAKLSILNAVIVKNAVQTVLDIHFNQTNVEVEEFWEVRLMNTIENAIYTSEWGVIPGDILEKWKRVLRERQAEAQEAQEL